MNKSAALSVGTGRDLSLPSPNDITVGTGRDLSLLEQYYKMIKDQKRRLSLDSAIDHYLRDQIDHLRPELING